VLELLSVWQLSIPKLAQCSQEHSVRHSHLNEERRIGDPLRRRSFYCALSIPPRSGSGDRRAKDTGLQPRIHAGMAGLAKALRGWSLEKPPSVSEILDLAQALKVLALSGLRLK